LSGRASTIRPWLWAYVGATVVAGILTALAFVSHFRLAHGVLGSSILDVPKSPLVFFLAGIGLVGDRAMRERVEHARGALSAGIVAPSKLTLSRSWVGVTAKWANVALGVAAGTVITASLFNIRSLVLALLPLVMIALALLALLQWRRPLWLRRRLPLCLDEVGVTVPSWALTVPWHQIDNVKLLKEGQLLWRIREPKDLVFTDRLAEKRKTVLIKRLWRDRGILIDKQLIRQKPEIVLAVSGHYVPVSVQSRQSLFHQPSYPTADA
jgi:hypothetical protein